jgi:hypothetical protein
MRYVIFPWAISLGFKVWLAISNISPHTWCLEQITHALSGVGLILDHSPMQNDATLDHLQIILATHDTSLIPHNISLILQGLKYILLIRVISWLQETFPFRLPANSKPTDQVYQNVAEKVLARMPPFNSSDSVYF